MKEQSILHHILLAASRGATRLFRVNTGNAWQGRGSAEQFSKPGMVMIYPGDVVLRQAQPIRMGLTTGGSDLIGWTTVNGVAVFTAIEVKSATGRVRPEQQNFIDQVKQAGGLAGIARSDTEALTILSTPITVTVGTATNGETI